MKREERIAYYEAILDRVTDVVRAVKPVCEHLTEADEKPQDAVSAIENILPDLQELDDYYTSGAWRSDYEADEAGLLPADLKRGVLSQDAIYNLLDDALKLQEILGVGI